MPKFYNVAFRPQAEKEFGARQLTEVMKRAVAGARRQLQQTPVQFHHAFPHIAEHFHEDTMDKPVHGVFFTKYHQPGALTALLLRAMNGPGTAPQLSKSDDGDWAVLIQTWFGAGHGIGYKTIGKAKVELAFLCVLVRLNGDLVTAFPSDRYLGPGNKLPT